MRAAPERGDQLIGAARRRAWLDVLAIGAPALLLAAALGWRILGAQEGLIAALVVAVLLGLLAWRRGLGQDGARIAARLDAREQALEDSAHLLFHKPGALHGLAVVQRQRLEARLARGLPIDPRPLWSRRAIAGSWGLGALCAALLLGFGVPQAPPKAGLARPQAANAAPPHIAALRLLIIPPAYTGLPQRQQSAANAKIPAGARLEWSIQYSAMPESPRLVFADGAVIPLRRAQNRWLAQRVIDQSTLYRIEASGARQEAWHRLEVIADAPPNVRVVFPKERLSIAEADQTRWTPDFEAIDDYGVAQKARLRLTLANGEGEQIAVVSREMDVQGSGGGRRRRWAVPLDLARENLAPGGDLIVQVIVRDNRRPVAQEVEGPSVILRRPSEAALADGLDGLLVGNVPAFFRSQRQIIIDAQALIKQRRTLTREEFFQRANALGADQAALRFRYGQFVGEDSDGPPIPTADAPASEVAQEAQAHSSGDGHDHGEGEGEGEGEGADPAPRALNAVQSAARQFGHVHDDGDGANVFGSSTRSLLAQALDAMWGSERELRQARPEAALPFANQALEALKKAQSASRIYLRRTGSRLPPPDLARRLSGKRAGIDPARAAPPGDAASQAEAFAAWRALENRPLEGPVGAPPLRLEKLEAWALADSEARADPLELMAAIAAVRLDPACLDCRQTLRAALWPALQAPPTAQRRSGADRVGGRYLDALE